MISFPLTNGFITIRAASSITTVTQPESGWLDLSGFADVIAFLEVREVGLGGATTITLLYQTAPTKDEAFFQNMTASLGLATGLSVTKMLKASVTNPLSRFVRWQLGFTGTPSSAWDATFRIWLACNAEGKLRQAVGMSPATQSRIVGPPPMRNGGNGNSIYVPPSTGGGGMGTFAGGGMTRLPPTFVPPR